MLFFHTSNFFFLIFLCSPTGQFAYGFTKNFLVVYDLDKDIVSIQLGNDTWPDPSFLPHAVDVSQDLLFVVIGYVGDSSTKYTPCAYLVNISNTTFNVLDSWLYTPPTNTSWQASLTNWDADVYAAKYDMSVSMNNAGDQVLLGIQITNTIVLLDVDQAIQQFGSSMQTLSNGKAIGMGKAVGWLGADIILVLVNIYSFSYVWSSSQIFTYNVSVDHSFAVISIFPNIQQTLTNTFGPILLSFAATPNGTVVMLDSDGNYYILLPSPAGSFSGSSSGTSSSSSQCISGTYSSELNIFPCSLCPPGTTTDGLSGQSSCVPCVNDSFCPLGAAFGNISLSSYILTNVNQSSPYPVSPQSVRFDNILMENMLKISGSMSSHCLLVSPLFWTIIVISFGVFVWIIMFIFKHYVTNPIGKKTRQNLKRILKKTDLIGEGEMVVGGLFSFPILVLIVFAYAFSTSYLYRYPIEQVNGPSNFACDPTLTNAQFTSNLMATSITPSDEEEPIFALLNAQPFTLHIVFINTIFKCTDVTAMQVKDINLPITISSCNESDSSIAVTFFLPSHSISLQVQLADIHTISGLRIGLEAPGTTVENAALNSAYTLVDLVFAQTLSINGRLLTQQPSCTLQLTKLINRTYPLGEGDKTQFSAFWLPFVSDTLDQMFVDENEYKYATSSSTVLSIVINETPYYILNTQRPIADQDEVIFTDLLFTIVCLEIFGLGFLIFKLIIAPLIKRVVNYCPQRRPPENSYKNYDDLPEIFMTRM